MRAKKSSIDTINRKTHSLKKHKKEGQSLNNMKTRHENTAYNDNTIMQCHPSRQTHPNRKSTRQYRRCFLTNEQGRKKLHSINIQKDVSLYILWCRLLSAENDFDNTGLTRLWLRPFSIAIRVYAKHL